MIIDKNNSREVTLGNGSVLMGIGTINGKEIAYFIHEHTNPNPKVGEHNNEFAGEKAEDLPVKCVALRFEGKEALKSIDMLIEDLQKIRENLIGESESNEEN